MHNKPTLPMRPKQRTALMVASLLLASVISARSQTPQLKVNPNTGETQEQFAQRTEWWRLAKFGMFIHWGVYSVPADSSKGAAEWYMHDHKVQVKDYEKFPPQFDPVKFDARKWVTAAKNAGMKYIVITSKHHDGFCMFDSKLTDYTIVKATPYKRDPMKALAAECRRQGLKFCFYYSIMDWHQPDYLPRREWETTTRPAGDASLDNYIGYMKGQLSELLTNYGPIGGIWFDGGWEHNASELHSSEVNTLIRSLQPNVLINDRDQLPEDYSTPEQTIPANALPGGRLWETCMTLNNTWGYSRTDHDWKSSEDLIHKLCDIASKGGNFLLNVGPTEMGEFTPDTLDRLNHIGAWMKVNSKSIYGTTKSPFKKLSFDGRCTQKGNTLYLQVFHWPTDGLKLVGLKTPVIEARTLAGNKPLTITNESDAIVISKPDEIDPVATVIELRLAGPPVVDQAVMPIKSGPDGSLTLTATDAEILGNTAQVETKENIPNIGYWTNQNDKVAWTVDVPRDGVYTVEIEYACASGSAGSSYRIQSDGSPESVEGKVQDTGSWGDFHTETLPTTLRLTSGRHTLTITPLTMPNGAVMNLRRIVLKSQ